MSFDRIEQRNYLNEYLGATIVYGLIGQVAICARNSDAHNAENHGLLSVDRRKNEFCVDYEGEVYKASAWILLIRQKLGLNNVSTYSFICILLGKYKGLKLDCLNGTLFGKSSSNNEDVFIFN